MGFEEERVDAQWSEDSLRYFDEKHAMGDFEVILPTTREFNGTEFAAAFPPDSEYPVRMYSQPDDSYHAVVLGPEDDPYILDLYQRKKWLNRGDR